MKTRFLKRLVAVGALVSSGALLAGTQSAFAAPTGQSPQFFTTIGMQPVRAAGSETTYYLMARLGSLWMQTSIFGCTLSSTDNRSCTGADSPTNTDTLDDWSRQEYINGAGVGSGGGIGQLCANSASGGLAVDFARSSRAVSAGDKTGACTGSILVGMNYADDQIMPITLGDSTERLVAGATLCSASPCTAGQQIGPVSRGWRPGDAIGGPYTGHAFTNLTTTGGAASLMQRILCHSNGSPITDWGQLTDPAQPVGSGAPIGAPLYIPAVNTKSGTYSVWKGLAGCDPNGNNTDGQIAQENDVPQMYDLALADHPGSTTAALVAQSNQLMETFYYMSFGVSAWRPYTESFTFNGFTYAGNQLSVDNVSPAPACAVPNSGACFDNNSNPVTQINSARALNNIIRTDTLRASTAGFLDWICDEDPTLAHHGKDLTTGSNYANEVDYEINTDFVFTRVPCLGTASAPIIPFVANGGTPPSGGAAIHDMNS
ncbi:MAG: hypothetical protein ACYDH6_23370 [Acidimicrobiales bacterium]